MRLSVSNIGWSSENDLLMYSYLKELEFSGIEIAPTRIIPENPYENAEKAYNWSMDLYNKYSLSVSSVQSIWYGRKEMLFGNEDEKKYLFDYTKKAIDFAGYIGCRNLVFGCPKNRNIPDNGDAESADSFFTGIGNYASEKSVVFSLEANPSVYGTNFLNSTDLVFDIVNKINSPGIKVNLDTGTMITNDEPAEIISGKVSLINHVHISEPFLAPVQKRKIHKDIIDILKDEGYSGFISVEMAFVEDISVLKGILLYIKELVS